MTHLGLLLGAAVLLWYGQRRYRKYLRDRDHQEILRRRYGAYQDWRD